MTPITKVDIDRLRRKIERIEVGRMRPSETARQDAEADPERDADDYFPERYATEDYLDGEERENAHGKYWVQERLYPNHKRHGNYEISRLAEMPGEWLEKISKGDLVRKPPERWAFLDTETTGLSGGTGTCAFLVGVGVIDPEGFRVRLFFMRDYDEETAMLAGLVEFLEDYDVLVTYNGKSYDAPLLETRFRLRRIANPLPRLQHLDLLHGARSLWKLRMESCRLAHLENQILGVEREGDLPGEMIPYCYFEYLRNKQAFKLVPLFHHNVIDIVSLACLTGVVLPAFDAPKEAELDHGEDLLGLARWLRRSGAAEEAVDVYRRAVDQGMRDPDLFAALWERALLEKKRKAYPAMLELFKDLAGSHNDFQSRAHVELAKHHERITKKLTVALGHAQRAYELDPEEPQERRLTRLERRIAKQPRGPKLFSAAR